MTEMMDCGHAANSDHRLKDGTSEPACVICAFTKKDDPKFGLRVVKSPILAGRMARCAYFGQVAGRRNECDACQKQQDKVCRCEHPSLSRLAFFEYQPDEEYDRFYCGCAFGWD